MGKPTPFGLSSGKWGPARFGGSQSCLPMALGWQILVRLAAWRRIQSCSSCRAGWEELGKALPRK